MTEGHISSLETVRMAARAMQANVFRSALTTLGIVIGVAAVIAMTAIGSGAQKQVSDRIRSLGTNVLIVAPGSSLRDGLRAGAGTRNTLTEDDAVHIAQNITNVVVAAPLLSGSARLVVGNRNWSTVVGGITSDYLVARDWAVIAGRSFDDSEVAGAAKVALLGQTTARQLFDDDDALGKTIRIANVPFTVVGILSEKGQAASSNRDQDDVAFVPISTAKLRVIGSRSKIDRRAVELIMVKATSEDALPNVMADIRFALRHLHRIPEGAEDDFSVREPSAMMEAQAAATWTLTILLAAIASVSLLVGGIGIMNIMLVSVTERTREIGLRQAIGARRQDVRNQFLAEAVLLCLFGGAAGVIVGVVTALLITWLVGWPISLSLVIILVGFSFAAAVGLFFGMFPAYRAAKLNLVDALRFE